MKIVASALALAVFVAPASAKVIEVSERGFVVRHVVDVPADAEDAWAMLVKPSAWWDSEHTWSGDAANLTIEPRAGGCFCEVLPGRGSPKGVARGGVEHMRVIYVERPRALRMAGVLGPLQADAADGTMTIEVKAAESGEGTRILLEYIVGGYVRTPYAKLAPAVDGVLAEQFRRLAEKLGGKAASSEAPEGPSDDARPEMIGR